MIDPDNDAGWLCGRPRSVQGNVDYWHYALGKHWVFTKVYSWWIVDLAYAYRSKWKG